ncbi:MAG: biotin/lipoyl-containing protein [Chloroflexota bacterium]|nr:biotin/lipoyl-containing protein [Chloroflexota bacterium]
MKRYRITLNDQTFDVKVLDDPRREQVRVEVDGETFVVGVEGVRVEAEPIVRETAPNDAAPRPSRFQKTSEVSAPLPGVIKSVAVRTGQRVAPDDELLIIEAMKMDNVIRAARTGIVGAIHVTEGRQVAHGERLLDLTDEG